MDKIVKNKNMPKWRVDSIIIRDKLGVPDDFMPWSKMHGYNGVPDVARFQDCLEICYITEQILAAKKADMAADFTKEPQDDLYCDFSQAADRSPWSKNCLRTFATSSKNYSFRRKRVIFAQEQFGCLGYNFKKLNFDYLSTRQIRELAGEAVALPSMALVLRAVIGQLDLDKPDDDDAGDNRETETDSQISLESAHSTQEYPP